jgi:hypothetical protein
MGDLGLKLDNGGLPIFLKRGYQVSIYVIRIDRFVKAKCSAI